MAIDNLGKESITIKSIWLWIILYSLVEHTANIEEFIKRWRLKAKIRIESALSLKIQLKKFWLLCHCDMQLGQAFCQRNGGIVGPEFRNLYLMITWLIYHLDLVTKNSINISLSMPSSTFYCYTGLRYWNSVLILLMLELIMRLTR